MCLVLAGFIAFRKGRVRRNGLQKDAQTQAEDNQADELLNAAAPAGRAGCILEGMGV